MQAPESFERWRLRYEGVSAVGVWEIAGWTWEAVCISSSDRTYGKALPTMG